MRRVMVLVLLVSAVGVAGGQSTDACAGIEKTTNTSAYQQCVDELQSEKNTLQNKLVQKNGRIEELEFQLEQSGGDITTTTAREMEERGAWINATNTPAIFRQESTPEQIRYYVWIGNADPYYGTSKRGFNGRDAWVPVQEKVVENSETKVLVLPEEFATVQGVKQRYTYSNPIEKQQIAAQLRDNLNTPAGWNAANLYIANQLGSLRQETSTDSTLLRVGLGGVILVGIGVGAYLNRSQKDELGRFDKYWARSEEDKREAADTGQSRKQVKQKRRGGMSPFGDDK